MRERPDPVAWEDPGVAPLLAGARFEVVPLRGAEEEAGHLPPGTTVTVTSSPRKGVDASVGLAERLATMGFRAVPHLSARLVRAPGHLRDIVDRLAAAGVEDVFVIGGDPPEPLGPYGSALALLEAMADLGTRFREVGIAGYPERHPLISPEDLLRALVHKQPLASYVVTQICFDPATIFWWLVRVRELGVYLPVHIGMPGAVTRRRLLEIALRIGVGDSMRYVSKRGSLVARLTGRGSYRPDSFLARLSPHLAEPGHDLRGFHINTFNQVRTTERWRRRALAAYGWAGRLAAGGESGERGYAS